MSIENIVPEDEADAVTSYKLPAYDESLCKALGVGLFGIRKTNTKLAAVTEKMGKSREIFRSAYDENIANSRQHEDRQRVVDHGLVIDRQELLAYDFCYGIEPGAGAPGKDYPLPPGSSRGLTVA
jgi:hypothetical protein